MRIFYDLNDLPKFKNAVITIGSFDGVHSGHQKILERINHLAEDIGGESVVITFHPHPRLVVYPKDDSLRLLTTIKEKTLFFERYNIDNVVIVPFTIEFSQISADEYVQRFLVEKFRPYFIVIGYDHRFGLNRQGDISFLKWHSKKNNFKVIEIEKYELENIAVSSTKIRKAIEKGNVKTAGKLLNHYYTLTGTVISGQKIGHSIGFPTANILINDKYKLIPPNGVYAVFVHHQQERYEGMLYIGKRPVLKNHHNRTIEVNIFNFDKNIYGDPLHLELIDFVRNDAHFEHLEALSKQLEKDKQQVEMILQKIIAAENLPSPPPQLEAKVAIVILNYNGKKYLKQFLPSVLNSTYPRYKVYVADNGSTDDSLIFLKNHFPRVRRIDLKKNYGFAEGYNKALQQVSADYYVLLNSDVEVAPNWIEPIIELMEKDKTIAACQPKILSYYRKTHFEYAGASGGWIDQWGYPFCRGRIFSVIEKDEGQYNDTQEIFWASGAALFIRPNLFHEVGGFDGDHFAHLEEIDLCWRLKRAAYKIMVCPDSIVYHVGGGTLNYNTPRKAYLNFRNSLYTLVKNEEKDQLLWLIPWRMILDGLAGLLFFVQGKWLHIFSIIRAHWTFLPHLSILIKKRRIYQEKINRISINASGNNYTGRYTQSIVWQFYSKGKRFFRELEEDTSTIEDQQPIINDTPQTANSKST